MFSKISLKFFNNSLSIKINILYFLHYLFCRFFSKNLKLSKKDKLIHREKSLDLVNKGFTKIKNVFSIKEIKEINSSINKSFKDKTKTLKEDYYHFNLTNPITKNKIKLKKILNNDEIKNIISNYYKTYFKIQWVDCYRTFPSNQLYTSWLWHTDNHPTKCLKLMLLLTDQNEESGAMKFINLESSKQIKKKGFIGKKISERVKSFLKFKKIHNLNFKEISFSGKAGDMYIFNANCFHKAIVPKKKYRDISTMFVLPHYFDFNEVFNKSIESKLEKRKTGWMLNPWKL